jgi:hypothetical protein
MSKSETKSDKLEDFLELLAELIAKAHIARQRTDDAACREIGEQSRSATRRIEEPSEVSNQ